jgi:hypothetical protein
VATVFIDDDARPDYRQLKDMKMLDAVVYVFSSVDILSDAN